MFTVYTTGDPKIYENVLNLASSVYKFLIDNNITSIIFVIMVVYIFIDLMLNLNRIKWEKYLLTVLVYVFMFGGYTTVFIKERWNEDMPNGYTSGDEVVNNVPYFPAAMLGIMNEIDSFLCNLIISGFYNGTQPRSLGQATDKIKLYANVFSSAIPDYALSERYKSWVKDIFLPDLMQDMNGYVIDYSSADFNAAQEYMYGTRNNMPDGFGNRLNRRVGTAESYVKIYLIVSKNKFQYLAMSEDYSISNNVIEKTKSDFYTSLQTDISSLFDQQVSQWSVDNPEFAIANDYANLISSADERDADTSRISSLRDMMILGAVNKAVVGAYNGLSLGDSTYTAMGDLQARANIEAQMISAKKIAVQLRDIILIIMIFFFPFFMFGMLFPFTRKASMSYWTGFIALAVWGPLIALLDQITIMSLTNDWAKEIALSATGFSPRVQKSLIDSIDSSSRLIRTLYTALPPLIVTAFSGLLGGKLAGIVGNAISGTGSVAGQAATGNVSMDNRSYDSLSALGFSAGNSNAWNDSSGIVNRDRTNGMSNEAIGSWADSLYSNPTQTQRNELESNGFSYANGQWGVSDLDKASNYIQAAGMRQSGEQMVTEAETLDRGAPLLDAVGTAGSMSGRASGEQVWDRNLHYDMNSREMRLAQEYADTMSEVVHVGHGEGVSVNFGVGSSGSASFNTNSALNQIGLRAIEIAQANPDLSRDQFIARVLNDETMFNRLGAAAYNNLEQNFDRTGAGYDSLNTKVETGIEQISSFITGSPDTIHRGLDNTIGTTQEVLTTGNIFDGADRSVQNRNTELLGHIYDTLHK